MWRLVLAGALAALLATGCGGGGDDEPAGRVGPFSSEITSCLEKGGAIDVRSKEEGDLWLVFGTTQGENIFILSLPERRDGERAIQMIREEKTEAGVPGIMIFRTLNDGFTLVGVSGHAGESGGVPSVATERLARECATKPTV